MAKEFTRDELFKRTIELCLQEGFSPRGATGDKGSALGEAERRLRASGDITAEGRSILAKWCNTQEGRRERGAPHYCPNWTLYRNTQAGRGNLGFAPVMPGYHVKSVASKEGDKWIKQTKEPGAVFVMPEGQQLKEVSALTDPDGRIIVQWNKTKASDVNTATIDMIKAAFADWQPAVLPVARQDNIYADALTLLPLPDLHLGMFAWGKETAQNWDLNIATTEIGAAMARLLSVGPPTKNAVILGGGDAMHSDTNANRTANSGNALQVDGRYGKVLRATCHLFVRFAELALQKHEHVTIRVLQGNHDEHASFAIAYFLLAWFRNEPRVDVDAGPSLFWFYRFGKVMIAATHGHEAKASNMPAIMATRRPQDWGETTARYAHTFHVHHMSKFANEGHGAVVETHQAPCPQDAWHYGQGFLSGRSLQSIVYDAELGEVSRSRIPL